MSKSLSQSVQSKKTNISFRAIRHVLIANRGEIACRIARAARERGVRVTTLYTPEEADYPQRMAGDTSVDLGDGSLAETYLNIDRLIDIAKASGCDAIHPGYGFLSERAVFAERCAQAGITFIGPQAEHIDLMGDKARSKYVAKQAGVPVIPGYEVPQGESKPSAAVLQHEAERIGFPVLIKASAGGGGKGMRVVETPEAFQDALAACEREALAAFGSDDVLLEKYLKRPRHIEIQVACDHHGHHVAIGERECSIQRRHQKIVEESPSPCVDDLLREKMSAYAIALVSQIVYSHIGTLEFLVDDARNVYFLEMNTRLQVEHTVTEERYGIDLVSLQFDLAEGRPLPFTQENLHPMRYAIECRISSEDPDMNFLPSIGTLHRLRLPAGPGIRLDMGLVEGNTVSMRFDPMLGKLIAFGQSREQAIARALSALEQMVCLGVKTNLAFLIALLRHPVFQAGDLHIHLLDELSLLDHRDEPPVEVLALLKAALLSRAPVPTGRVDHQGTSSFDRYPNWRLIGGAL